MSIQVPHWLLIVWAVLVGTSLALGFLYFLCGFPVFWYFVATGVTAVFTTLAVFWVD